MKNDIDGINSLFVDYDEVQEVQILFSTEKSAYNLKLILKCNINEIFTNVLLVNFYNIKFLNIQNSGNNFTQWAGLHIRKRDDGWEYCNYEVIQIEEEDVSFSFYSFDYEIISV
ncbi:hypothetical protein QTA56_09515 [Acinetobacter sp. VNH17]|jgi:hypothetical protein|uniref:Uncharacterized protein n=1 Tax=Acinetobacter thutiue TaxID=2998078 RepID=A0ABT7WP79_9GAMM|nr:hypothetical protein [Acinetobacter thutiue]MCY6412368.1 hypothetical protein [Acinetobacter thutiue]MDN0014472.1 hypothetical protein [Acinetobacter thutiue]